MSRNHRMDAGQIILEIDLGEVIRIMIYTLFLGMCSACVK
jgi:hypothetical protein